MSLRVYNTLTKQKELFQPVRPGKVGMYLCGPTVYKAPHIGHMVGPVIFDAVKRYLKYKGFEVTWVVNITDVDDKLIDAAAKHNTTVLELAEKHTKEYFECLGLLGIDTIDKFPKASEHMPEIIAMCQGLISSGFAYAAGGNVWFDVAKDADYGKLSHRSVEQQESGGRTLEAAGKRNAADFALWKTAKPGEPAWESPWGPGRPGWHIECSAMSTKYLGPTFDIHGGGMDLMFPHHENELAQSESATGQKFVNFWMHNGLTKVRTKAQGGEWKSEDMHESAGNAIRVRELIEQHGSELIRYLLLSTHYRRPIDFSAEVLESSKKGMSVFFRLFDRVTRLTGKALDDTTPDMDVTSGNMLETPHGGFARDVLGLKMKFLEMMDDDFNTAGGIAVMHELSGAINAFIERNDLEKTKHTDLLGYVTAAAQTLRRIGIVLGMFRMPMTASSAIQDETLNKVMQLLIRLRAEARVSKNFALADSIRKGLTEIGVTLEDRADATLWRRDYRQTLARNDLVFVPSTIHGTSVPKMRILGIDPGLQITGYGVIDWKPIKPPLVDGGVIRLSPKSPLADRLLELEKELDAIITEHKPDVCAVEQLYSHYAHPRTAILMGHARGVILLVARRHGLEVEQFAANRIKQSVTGNGHASKIQMQRAVQAQWNLPEIPEPPDVADALAVALCCGMHLDRISGRR